MTLFWFVIWLVWNLVGDREPLLFDPVNFWTGSLLLAIALDLGELLDAPEVFHGRVEELAEVVEAQRIAGDGAALAQEAGFVARPAVEVTPGHAGDAIVAYAEQVGADAIVVGARGLSTVKSLLLGSVSHGVVQHAHVPVLVVHTRGQ